MNQYFIRCRSSFSILSLQGSLMAAKRLLARGRPCGGAEHFVNYLITLRITSPLTLEVSPKSQIPT